MSKLILSIIIALFLPLILLAQTDRWVYTYNGPNNFLDEARSIASGPDGNIYAAGYSYGIGTVQDFTVISLDTGGDTNWVYRYNGPTNSTDIANAITVGADGNLYVAGRRNGFNFIVINLDTSGTQEWLYNYGSGEASSIVYGLDDNIYAAGNTSTGGVDFAVISIDTGGTQRWVYEYDGPESDYDQANAVVYGLDGNIYAAGYCTDTTWLYIFTVISLTTDGDTNWTYQYTGSGTFDNEAKAIVYGPDDNLYVAGYSTDSSTWVDLTVISLDTTGTERWIYTYNGSGNFYDWANVIVYGPDGNLYVAGTSWSTNYDFIVFSLTTDGDTNWVYTAPSFDEATCLVYGADDYIYAGGFSSNIGIACLTNTGNENWFYSYDGPGGSSDWCTAIMYGSDSTVYATGASVEVAPWPDFAVISMFSDMYSPSIPQLISPSDNAYLNDPLVTCIWHQAVDTGSGIKNYVFHYAMDSLFTGVDSVVLADTFYTNTFLDITYFWRVKAADSAGNQSTWSDVWSFNVDTLTPEIPLLVSPINGIVLSDTTVTFEWTEVYFMKNNNFLIEKEKRSAGFRSAPVRYVLQADTGLTFTVPLVIDTTDTHSVSLNITENFYYWRVKAFDLAQNESPYSNPDSFGVDISPPLIDSTSVWSDTSYAGPFPVYTNVIDNSGVDTVILYYKRTEDPAWFFAGMTEGMDNWYNGLIPEVFMLDDTVKYYIYAEDILGQDSTDPGGAPGNYYSFIANFTGIMEHQDIPKVFSFGLKQNPTRGKALFSLALPSDAMVNLNIYDVCGRLVAQPLAGKKSAGFYELPWTPTAAGVYFYNLNSPWQHKIGKLVLLK